MYFHAITDKIFCNDKNPVFSKFSDANLPFFGEIRQFFDQMVHFCESSRTNEKNLGVLGNCECAFFI